ncbi:tudor and KH domain-containing protein isoform X2 [Hydra vulgaris]|uniref:Tudor and KH domain-containing protein isoform X2 n=1 Tax=Hydra vulgaris TaxID=6087 RepID=A0ABM4CJZ1_HYDVU
MNSHQEKYILIACISSAVVLASIYFLYRKKKNTRTYNHDENNEVVESNDLNSQDNNVSDFQTKKVVKVPSHIVGSIIGKNGTNINYLKSYFGVRLDFKNKEENDLINDQEILTSSKTTDEKLKERTLIITGNYEQVQAAEEHIKKLILEAPPILETEILVPQSTCGRIIGKGGQNIREMCNTSGAKIIVNKDQDSSIGDQCRVRITGTKTQVDDAILLVKKKVFQETEFHKKNKTNENAKKENTDFTRKKQFDQIQNVIELPSSIIQKPLKSLQLPINEYFKVFVSAFETPEHIWVQYLHSEFQFLDALIKEMTEFYGGKQSQIARLEKGTIGDICVAPFDNDSGEMFRACIKSVNLDSRAVELFYIDFGDTGYQDIDQLKQIRSEHLVLPPQAVECYLPISAKDSDWSDEALEHFENIVHCSQWLPLVAKVIGYKNTDTAKYPILQMVDSTEEKELDICDDMVKKGYAIDSSKHCIENDGLLTTLDHPNNNEYACFEFETCLVKPADVKGVQENIFNVKPADVQGVQEDICNELEGGSVFHENLNFLDNHTDKTNHQRTIFEDCFEEKQNRDQHLENQFFDDDELIINTHNKVTEQLEECGIISSLMSGVAIQNKTSSESSTDSLCNIPTPKSTSSRHSSDDFVNINDNTLSGAILSVVNEHLSDNLNRDEEFKELNGDISKSSEEIIVNEFTELQKSLEETSRKNVKSMEFTSDDDDDTGSFFSARSEVTITDIEDVNAEELSTIESDISVNIPDFSSVELLEAKSINDFYDSMHDSLSKGPVYTQKNGLPYSIQVIDEKKKMGLSSESIKVSSKDHINCF